MTCPSCGREKRGSLCVCGYLGQQPASRPTRRHSAPYQPGSRTSRAGANVAVAVAPTQRDEIVAWVASQPEPVTNGEIEVALGLPANVVSARVNAELGPGGRLRRATDRPSKTTGVLAHTVEVSRG